MSWRNYQDKIKRYFWFNTQELNGFLLHTAVLALVVSWNAWGGETFSAVSGVGNLVVALILMGLTIFVHHAGQRLYALTTGFRVEHIIWWPGLLFALAIALISRGTLQILAGASMVAHMLPIHRFGAHRPGANLSTIAHITLAGPVANIFFAGIVKTLEFVYILPASIADPIFNLNLLFAAWNLLPIPPLDGSKIFYASRMLYVFLFSTLVVYVAFIQLFNIYSYIYAITIGTIILVTYYHFVERSWSK